MISRRCTSKARLCPDRCQVTSGSFVLVARYDNRPGPREDVPRPRKVNFHSLVSRRLARTAKRDRRRRPLEDKEALLRRGERWKLRTARAEIGKDAGCVPVGVERQRRLPYIRGTRIITAQDGFISPRVSLIPFSYNGLKCIKCIYPQYNRVLFFMRLYGRHSL